MCVYYRALCLYVHSFSVLYQYVIVRDLSVLVSLCDDIQFIYNVVPKFLL